MEVFQDQNEITNSTEKCEEDLNVLDALKQQLVDTGKKTNAFHNELVDYDDIIKNDPLSHCSELKLQSKPLMLLDVESSRKEKNIAFLKEKNNDLTAVL